MLTRVLVAILLAASAHAAIAQNTSDDWAWDYYSDEGAGEFYLFAGTVNDEDRFLGKYCDILSGECAYLVTQNISCSSGDKYPVLVSLGSEAVSTNLVCWDEFDTNEWAYEIEAWDTLDSSIISAKRMGIVVALVDGTFSVSRFSLLGSGAMISEMETVLEEVLAELSQNPKSTAKPSDSIDNDSTIL